MIFFDFKSIPLHGVFPYPWKGIFDTHWHGYLPQNPVESLLVGDNFAKSETFKDQRMYTPKLNQMTNQTECMEFMRRFSFATIITSMGEKPVATHLPFLIEERNEAVFLKSHFAKANEQWKHVENDQVLVIFSEPHAYISPRHYEKELNVPTWNYLAVHAYGKGRIISETGEVISLLEQTIDQYEEAYRKQWNDLPMDYKLGMAKGIVAFEIEVTELQGKKKLSQNKTELEKSRIIDSLSGSPDTNERVIAEYMKAL